MPRLRVEVCYAQAQRQARMSLEFAPGTTAGEAVAASGLGGGIETAALAIFGRVVTPGTTLRDGDRVDILRPLAADPKEARRQRARRTRP